MLSSLLRMLNLSDENEEQKPSPKEVQKRPEQKRPEQDNKIRRTTRQVSEELRSKQKVSNDPINDVQPVNLRKSDSVTIPRLRMNSDEPTIPETVVINLQIPIQEKKASSESSQNEEGDLQFPFGESLAIPLFEGKSKISASPSASPASTSSSPATILSTTVIVNPLIQSKSFSDDPAESDLESDEEDNELQFAFSLKG